MRKWHTIWLVWKQLPYVAIPLTPMMATLWYFGLEALLWSIAISAGALFAFLLLHMGYRWVETALLIRSMNEWERENRPPPGWNT